MRTKLQIITLCVSLFLVTPAALSQTASSSMGPDYMSGVPGTFAITNAHIVTVSGADIDNGTVVISNGKIQAVGSGVSVPSDAKTIDARGLFVFPGMIDLSTEIGLIEITENGATGWIDTQEIGEMNPNAQAYFGINPHSAHVGVARVNGITSVLSVPQGGTISGQAAFINLLGSTPKEMAVLPQAALVITYPRAPGGFSGFGGFFQAQNPADAATARERQIESLRKMLRDAEAYGHAVDAAARDRNLPKPEGNVMLASLVPYVRGERPVIFRADSDTDIRAAIRFAEEMRLKPIILGGDEAWKAASFLKEHNVPVILRGVWNLPNLEDDAYDIQYENAAKLQQAGVRFCISSGEDAANVRDLPYEAGMSAAFGLSKTDALKSVTLYPAQIMGIADQMGTIDVGKVANLVVADGDILEPRTNIRYLFINGRQVPLVSRHTELYEMFRNRK